MTIAFNLDSIVAEGYLAAGVKPSVIASRSNAGRDLVKRLNMSGRARVAPNINKWSKQDDDFMRAHYRYMTDEEVGQAMGRSAVAVVIRRKRLGLPAPSKHPDELTATAIKHLLGVDEHAICSWIDSGILRGRLMPGAREIRLVKRIDLLLWCINPESWLRFKVEQVRDPKLKRMIEMRMARWGDEWWTTRQVADYHDADIRAVNARIKRKTLRCVKARNISGRHDAPAWAYNFVRKSDAVGLVFTSGKGSATVLVSKIAPALEQFIEHTIGAGVPMVCVAEMIGWTSKRLSHWVRRYKGGAKALRFVEQALRVRTACWARKQNHDGQNCHGVAANGEGEQGSH